MEIISQEKISIELLRLDYVYVYDVCIVCTACWMERSCVLGERAEKGKRMGAQAFQPSANNSMFLEPVNGVKS